MAVEIRIAVTVMVILTAYTHCRYQVLLKTAMYHGKINSLHVVVYCLVTFFMCSLFSCVHVKNIHRNDVQTK